MNFEIFPISKIQVEWKNLCTILKMVIGPDPIKQLEESKLPHDNVGAFYRLLEGSFTEAAVCESIFYGFLIIGTKDELFKLMQKQNIINLNVTNTIKEGFCVALATASLEDWRRFILDNTRGIEDFVLRVLANRLMGFFEKEGLSRIFWQWNKVLLKDNTLALKIGS